MVKIEDACGKNFTTPYFDLMSGWTIATDRVFALLTLENVGDYPFWEHEKPLSEWLKQWDDDLILYTGNNLLKIRGKYVLINESKVPVTYLRTACNWCGENHKIYYNANKFGAVKMLSADEMRIAYIMPISCWTDETPSERAMDINTGKTFNVKKAINDQREYMAQQEIGNDFYFISPEYNKDNKHLKLLESLAV